MKGTCIVNLFTVYSSLQFDTEPVGSPPCDPLIAKSGQDDQHISSFNNEGDVKNNRFILQFIFFIFFFFFFFRNGNTERAQCALSLVCIPQEMEKSKTSL